MGVLSATHWSVYDAAAMTGHMVVWLDVSAFEAGAWVFWGFVQWSCTVGFTARLCCFEDHLLLLSGPGNN